MKKDARKRFLGYLRHSLEIAAERHSFANTGRTRALFYKLVYTNNMPQTRPHILDVPFFSLEYSGGVFTRHIPADAEDMGGGLFRQDGKIWMLPEGGGDAALAEKTVKGRPLLSLLNRGHNPLIKKGPRLAADNERLEELHAVTDAGALCPGETGAGPLAIELRRLVPESEWLPLEGLPRRRLYRGLVYETISDETLRELFDRYGERRGKADGAKRFVLRGEDIPRFAAERSRLIFQFGDARLKELLAEDSVFVRQEALHLILGAAAEQGRGAGSRMVMPLLRYGSRRYPAEAASMRMDREYILLEKQWARREDIEAAGIFPLCAYAGGADIEKIVLKPGEVIRRGSGRLAGLFSALEIDTSRWLERGGKGELFRAHLEFLREWGLSGGITLNGRGGQREYLAAWLKELAASGAAQALVLMEKRYYELYLPLLLPESGNSGSIALPGAGGESRNAPVRIAFYEDLPLSPADQKKTFAVLVLVEPEEVLSGEQAFSGLKNIRAGVVLGIFSGAGELFHGQLAARVKNLFGVKEAELLPYLMRDAEKPLSLPQYEFPAPKILRPAGLPVPAGIFKCAAIEKFSGLSGPSLYSEIALFGVDGQPSPFVPLRLLKDSLDIERMDDAELAFFLYWRGAFRRGNIIKTDAGYIRVYARELCLFSGGADAVMGNFRELLRLWEVYSSIFESLNSFLPRWLLDYAAVYEIADAAFPLLMPYTKIFNDPALSDYYIYNKFIANNNAVSFGDAVLLTPKITVPWEHRLVRDFETVINAVDRRLREEYRLKLFEFFFPQNFDAEKREAFFGMEHSGCSSYTIEGIRFSKHPPLIAFLEHLFRYTEYRFNLKNGLELKGNAPPLGEAWKRIVDEALGVSYGELIPSTAKPRSPVTPVLPLALPAKTSPPAPQIRLLETRIEKLRGDSDAVRGLLKIEESPTADAAPPPAPFLRSAAVKKHVNKSSLKNFIKHLDKACREALKIISGWDDSHAALEIIAKKHNTMPELLVDSINAAFLEISGDLLIDTVDEKPLVQQEYREETKKLLGGA